MAEATSAFAARQSARYGATAAARRRPGPLSESSTNLINWLPIATNTTPASPYDFVAGDAPDFPQRFYRVKQ